MADRSFLFRYGARWCDYTPDQQEAIADLITAPYVAKSLSPERFATENGLQIGTAECAARWAAFLRECKETITRAYAPDNILYSIFAQAPRRKLVAVGTMMWISGTRAVPIGQAIGDPESSLPTLRMLGKFRFPAGLGLIPEARVAELSRLVLRRQDELAALVASGDLAQPDREYLVRKGSDELLARTYFCGRAWATIPEAFVYNTPRRLAHWLNRKGLIGQELYREGAEPTPRSRNGPPLLRGYFDWQPILAPLVPEHVMAEGVAAAIRYLAHAQPEALDTLPISLPYLASDDEALHAAMTTLITSCGLQPLPDTAPRAAD